MDPIRLLVVDASLSTRNAIREIATAEKFIMDEAIDGITAIKLFRRFDYRLILLNVDLPELDGRNVCIQIRKLSDVPIFILCDHPHETKCLSAYELGADDYIRKPFNPQELLCRMKVFLRRSGQIQVERKQQITYKGLYIDTFSHGVYVDEILVPLTPKKYDLLYFLSQHPHRAFSRSELLDQVWGEDFLGSERTVDTHIKSLRSSIKPYEDYLVTIWGYGYKFEA